jgi:hypothetical protein
MYKMKAKQILFFLILPITCGTSCNRAPRLIADDEKIIEIKTLSCNDTVLNRYSPSVIINEIKYGFEGGCVEKIGNTYHLITAEMAGDPKNVNMRLGHWQSNDGIDWQRVGTVRKSDGDYTGNSQRSSVWGPMVIFNKEDKRWHLVYVCYKGKPGSDNYDGIIQHAISTTKGIEGINGPYEDKGILMRYDDNPDPWEGLQGTDSFFPYKAGKKWYGFYGSATLEKAHNDRDWSVGLAQADHIEGPWTRLSELNPVNKTRFVENPIVIQLENGVYIAIMDCGYTEGRPGYMLSWDGIHWSNVRYIDLEPTVKRWWSMMRTPLSLIKEDDGTYTMFFTAFKKYGGLTFGCVSKLKLEITISN